MSRLDLSNSSSSIGAGCLVTDVAEALSLSVCLFHNGLNAIVPLHVLRNCGAHELKWCNYDLFYLFSHLADAFIQSDLQMRTLLKQSKPTKEQKHASAIRSPG